MNEQNRDDINKLMSSGNSSDNDDIQKKMYDISDVLSSNFGNRLNPSGVEIIDTINNSDELKAQTEEPVMERFVPEESVDPKTAKKLKKEQIKKEKQQKKAKKAEEKPKVKTKDNTNIVVSDDRKFRARALLITGIVCVGIVIGGIIYVRSFQKPVNAVSSVPQETTTEMVEETTAITTHIDKSKLFDDVSVQSTTGHTKEMSSPSNQTAADTTVSDKYPSTVGELRLSAYADTDGCHISWEDVGNNYVGCALDIELSDGTSDFEYVQTVPLSDLICIINTDEAKDAVSARVTIKRNNETFATDTFMVENRTYISEHTGTDVRINGLFR